MTQDDIDWLQKRRDSIGDDILQALDEGRPCALRLPLNEVARLYAIAQEAARLHGELTRMADEAEKNRLYVVAHELRAMRDGTRKSTREQGR